MKPACNIATSIERFFTEPPIRHLLYVCTGTDDSFNTLTEDGIDELRDMLKDARRSEDAWNNFLEDFVDDPDVITPVKCRGPR